MEDYLKVNGRMIRDMGEVMKGIRMQIFIKESFSMEKHMVKVDINGFQHQKYMMESGLRAWDMAMAFGRKLAKIWINNTMTLISASGDMVKLMDMVFIHGVMEIDMKVNGNNAWKMVEVLIYFQMEISIQVNIKMENLKAMVYILGWMVIIMMVNS